MQSTWSADSTAWSSNSYVWANTTYVDTATLAANATQSNTGIAVYPSSVTFGANAGMTGSGGFQFVGNIVLGLSAGYTPITQQVFVESVTLASTEDMSSVGNKIYVDSITMGTTVNIPLPGTTTWNLETSTWDTATGSFGYSPSVAVPVAANITQVMLNSLNAEDIEKIASAILATEMGVGANASISIPLSGTLANEQTMKFNINFEESVTLSATSDTTSSSNFLWNDIAEDTGTTWTKVSDPDE